MKAEQDTLESAPLPADAGTVARLLHHTARRFLLVTEIETTLDDFLTMHNSNLHPSKLGWESSRLVKDFTAIDHPLRPFRFQPQCWWAMQALSYMFRPTAPFALAMLEAVAESVHLGAERAEYKAAATAAFKFPWKVAHRTMPTGVRKHVDAEHWMNLLTGENEPPLLNQPWHSEDETRASDWWASLRALKLQWQTRLCSVLTPDGSASDFLFSQCSTPPLLGYVFVRAGDKSSEDRTFGVEDFVATMLRIHRETGVVHFYVASDELDVPNRIASHCAQAAKADPISFPVFYFHFSPVAQGRIRRIAASADADAAAQLRAGYVQGAAAASSDLDRRGIVMSTLFEVSMSHLADFFIGAYSSNHNRLVYESSVAADGEIAGNGKPYFSLDTTWHRGDMGFADRKKEDVPKCKEELP